MEALIWHNFSLCDIMTNFRGKFAKSYPRICHLIVPTFALPHVIDKLTIHAFGMALSITQLALTLVLHIAS
jgi:hypothetical protein